MPLRDHFHPPLSDRRPRESFHTTWASALADMLNYGGLPPGFIALEQVHAGAGVEIDVATFNEPGSPSAPTSNGGVATATRTVWTPTTAPVILPATFPEGCTVEVHTTTGGRTLVAAIELVSPGNKDREAKRRLFAARCATHLARGVGLVMLDVVTSRQANLHNDLMQLLTLGAEYLMAAEQHLYCVAYRPLRQGDKGRIETWLMPLAVGEPLPAVPLSLEAEWCVRVDLEEAYQEACRRRRFDEVTE